MKIPLAHVCVAVVLGMGQTCPAQDQPQNAPAADQQNAAGTNQKDVRSATKKDAAGGQNDVAGTDQSKDEIVSRLDKIEGELKKEDPDWALSVGIGSLVLDPNVTDYTNSSNVIQSVNLGASSPQYLVGVSMRTEIPNLPPFGKKTDTCDETTLPPRCAVWRRRPWGGFVSLKFSPNSSQTLNGYVLGGSYAVARYMNIMIGFALTPVGEPAPGFRVAAAQFVEAQQKLGQDLNFDPAAMLAGTRNAYDGFPLTDPTGKLIYKGNALEVHYHGGAVFGISVPISFSSAFGSGGTKSQ